MLILYLKIMKMSVFKQKWYEAMVMVISVNGRNKMLITLGNDMIEFQTKLV